jgi:4-diphosphocytidyl-2-C-methyl-D-erythritol kinase
MLTLPYSILVCYPRIPISTAWAYQQVSSYTTVLSGSLKDIVVNGLKDPSVVSELLSNDFEPIVFRAHPLIREIKELMLREGALCASLSGSGSSVFGLFNDPKSHESVADKLRSWSMEVFETPPHFSPTG